MAIIYQCRHCSKHIGRLEEQVTDSASLGFDQLTSNEKKEMIEYKSNGDLIVKVICDYCESALAENPHYHELDHFIQ